MSISLNVCVTNYLQKFKLKASKKNINKGKKGSFYHRGNLFFVFFSSLFSIKIKRFFICMSIEWCSRFYCFLFVCFSKCKKAESFSFERSLFWLYVKNFWICYLNNENEAKKSLTLCVCCVRICLLCGFLFQLYKMRLNGFQYDCNFLESLFGKCCAPSPLLFMKK